MFSVQPDPLSESNGDNQSTDQVNDHHDSALQDVAECHSLNGESLTSRSRRLKNDIGF